MRAAIFDLDGTLADTSADLIGAANATLGAALLDPVKDQATAFRGGRRMLSLGLERAGRSQDEVEPLVPPFLARYADRIAEETVLYPGVEEALDLLASAGWRLGVCTNKPEGLAEALLAALAVRPRFQALLGADTLPVRKPDPTHVLETIARVGGDPRTSVMIGDTETDRNAARAARIPCVLVSFGPEGPGLARLSPEAMLDHYSDLPALLEKMIPPH